MKIDIYLSSSIYLSIYLYIYVYFIIMHIMHIHVYIGSPPGINFTCWIWLPMTSFRTISSSGSGIRWFWRMRSWSVGSGGSSTKVTWMAKLATISCSYADSISTFCFFLIPPAKLTKQANNSHCSKFISHSNMSFVPHLLLKLFAIFDLFHFWLNSHIPVCPGEPMIYMSV